MPDDEWITVKAAAIMIGVHDRTIRRYITDDKLISKKDGHRVLISKDSVNDLSMIDHSQDHIEDHIDHTPDRSEDHTANAEVEFLRDQIRRQDEEVEFLRERLREVEDQRNQEKGRSDTIILQLTRNLEQSQRLIEYHEDPWYRRMFRRRTKSE